MMDIYIGVRFLQKKNNRIAKKTRNRAFRVFECLASAN